MLALTPSTSTAACAASVGCISDPHGPEPLNISFAQYGLSARYWATPLILFHFRRLDLIRRSNSGVSEWRTGARPNDAGQAPELLAFSLTLMPGTTHD
jgi:hypothetical protein